jgi:hypothetical protein
MILITHARMRAHARTRTHAHARTHARAHTYTRTRARTHAHTHTYTRTHTLQEMRWNPLFDAWSYLRLDALYGAAVRRLPAPLAPFFWNVRRPPTLS